MPTSHTFANMVDEISTAPKGTENIASIVSPAGKSRTYDTPYNPKNKGKTTSKK